MPCDSCLLYTSSPEGGLYVPERWPALDPMHLDSSDSLASLAAKVLAPFAEADPLAAQLPQITAEAFNFPAPLRALGDDGQLSVLELFHGPTAAFKDFGARFLAASFARLRAPAQRPLQIDVYKRQGQSAPCRGDHCPHRRRLDSQSRGVERS